MMAAKEGCTSVMVWLHGRGLADEAVVNEIDAGGFTPLYM